MGLCRYPFAKKHQAAFPNTKPPEQSLHLQLLDNQHPCSPSLPADCCSGSYSLYPTQTYETCHSDFKGAFRSPFCSGDTFLAKHITLIELAVKQEGLQTMERLYTVQHGWWADHQVTWCKSYKISQRHKLKAQSLVLQRDVWFVEVWWGVFFWYMFWNKPWHWTSLGFQAQLQFNLHISSNTAAFPCFLQCLLLSHILIFHFITWNKSWAKICQPHRTHEDILNIPCCPVTWSEIACCSLAVLTIGEKRLCFALFMLWLNLRRSNRDHFSEN